jgi:hypothetical protein
MKQAQNNECVLLFMDPPAGGQALPILSWAATFLVIFTVKQDVSFGRFQDVSVTSLPAGR